MAKLILNNVGKTYAGGVTAVSGANVEIADGEFVVLVGPSGCGKSTILRMIAGLEEITEGEVTIGDRVVNRLEPGERDIAMVFQNYALYPHMSVRRNMEYGLRNQGMPRDEIAKRIAAAAETLQITQYLDRKPRALSGGQRQRVAMGRAIVREPAVFLFDEPLSNLDAKLRTQLRAELKDLHTRLGATFVFVTHDQVEAMSLADRIVIMSEGKVEQIGTPMELYRSPASRFVAEFIGAPPMNVFPLGSQAGLALSHLAAGHPPAAAMIGVRPEALRLSHDGPEGVVMLIEALGAENLIHLRLGEDRVILRAGHEGTHVREGQTVHLGGDADAITFFDADGRRMAPTALAAQ
ncbi:Glycerol-3-phosphate ABC transporter, ATP-binding protein UgpC [Roseibacterium elongatum DSM 19469]|uniref:Glycerol-3-phosphate ABC transporter, ATP-binding protein UgpC n=1 Tax=Roseicyclus elongatus DSM 19469 TaxID=1294273 RepID=W8S667_9RHOB|nr:sn-glycerol-3-phosphate ABC transporter ATP-binding protein UgpC [Roseibacterium elongatum]AHM05742.1 Glycerol-3-phosphate ABC transporter, ATP-binding protein UgpC [Roseibacterium elongatum DSM 19469]